MCCGESEVLPIIEIRTAVYADTVGMSARTAFSEPVESAVVRHYATAVAVDVCAVGVGPVCADRKFLDACRPGACGSGCRSEEQTDACQSFHCL